MSQLSSMCSGRVRREEHLSTAGREKGPEMMAFQPRSLVISWMVASSVDD